MKDISMSDDEPEDVGDRWERVSGEEFLKFDRVEPKRSKRSDLHAFLMLDELFPCGHDIVCHAEHDQIWLDIDEEQVSTLSDEQIIELSRCGVMFDDGLSMFV